MNSGKAVGEVVRLKGRKGKWKVVKAWSYTSDCSNCGEQFYYELCPIGGGSHLTAKHNDLKEKS